MTEKPKSASAFRTISEVAAELDLPQHVLRFWETKFNQIRPMKRGGGRRYYRPEDVEQLRKIRGLLYDQGYTIKGVQKLFRDGFPVSSEAVAPTEATSQEISSEVATRDKAELKAILAELQEIQGVLRNWA